MYQSYAVLLIAVSFTTLQIAGWCVVIELTLSHTLNKKILLLYIFPRKLSTQSIGSWKLLCNMIERVKMTFLLH